MKSTHPPNVVILCYHRVCEGNQWMNPRIFEQQLQLIADITTPVGLGEAADLIRNGGSRPKTACCITFDDGWADNVEIALPLLKKYGLSATLFASSGFIDAADPSLGPRSGDMQAIGATFARARRSAQFSTWDELRAAQETGVFQIEAHGHDHVPYFGHSSVQTIFDGTYRDSLHAWTLFAATGDERIGTPIYGPMSVLGGPRYYDNPNIRQFMQAAWLQTRERPLALSRSVAAIMQVSRHAEYQGKFQSLDEWKIAARNDLQACLDKFEHHLGRRPAFLAWPFGWWRNEGLEIAAELGLRDTATIDVTDLRPVPRSQPLPRVFAPSSVSDLQIILERGPGEYNKVVQRRHLPMRMLGKTSNLMISLLSYLPLGMLVGRSMPTVKAT